MKTIKSITLLLGILTLGWSTGLRAAVEEFNFEEACFDDIPSHTEELATTCQYKMALAVPFDFEEESYVDDIPFNTDCVTLNCRYQNAMKTVFNFEEEDYVDDIPFNTGSLLRKGDCCAVDSRK
ncbi:MAG: hypothetical protein L3J66_11470 [Bacteroidales bacterium]|nr:hypothetical protein [Bacteroidales bacterium]